MSLYSLTIKIFFLASPDKFVHLVVELLHFRDRAIFFEQDFIHVCLRIVIVSNISIINSFLENLGTLVSLSFLW